MGTMHGRVLRLVLFCTLCVFGRAEAIMINEVDADTEGIDRHEFIELYDGGGGYSPLDNLFLVWFNGRSDSSDRAFDLSGWRTDAHGFFLLGNEAVAPDLVFSDNSLQNGPDAIGLYRGDGTDFPKGTPATISNLIDVLVYGTSDKDDSQLKAALDAGVQYDDDPIHSLARTAEHSFVAADPTPGRHNFPAPVPTPEPGTLALMAVGIGAIGLRRYRART